MRDQNYLKSVIGTPSDAVKDVSEREDGFIGRIEDLSQLAAEMSAGLETIKVFHLLLRPPTVEDGIDFYEEIRRVEIFFIKRALKHTGGSQVKAASLLRLAHTTLNAKIKKYNIV